MYFSLTSLKAYLVIDHLSRIFAQLYTRQDNGWLLRWFKNEDETVPLSVIGVDLPITAVYRDVVFIDKKEENNSN